MISFKLYELYNYATCRLSFLYEHMWNKGLLTWPIFCILFSWSAVKLSLTLGDTNDSGIAWDTVLAEWKCLNRWCNRQFENENSATWIRWYHSYLMWWYAFACYAIIQAKANVFAIGKEETAVEQLYVLSWHNLNTVTR